MEASRSEDASVLLSSLSNLCFVVMEHSEVGGSVFREFGGTHSSTDGS